MWKKQKQTKRSHVNITTKAHVISVNIMRHVALGINMFAPIVSVPQAKVSHTLKLNVEIENRVDQKTSRVGYAWAYPQV